MATFFVDSNAAGANDGSSFADAFASILSVTLAPGDDVLVASDHAESAASLDLSLGQQNLDHVRFISVNSGTEDYEVGATLTTTSGDLTVSCGRFFGFTMDIDGRLLSSIAERGAWLEDCTIDCGDSVEVISPITLMNCDVTCLSTSLAIFNRSLMEIYGGSVSAPNVNDSSADRIFSSSSSRGSFIRCYGVDMSGCGSAFIGTNSSSDRSAGESIQLFGCLLNADISVDIPDGDDVNIETIGCVAGTVTDPVLQYAFANREGLCEAVTAVTRTDGASDGSTDYSMAFTAKGDKTDKSIISAQSSVNGISTYVEPGDTNVRIYIAHDGVGSGASGVLQDDECWAVYSGPSELATANALLRRVDTKTKFNITPSDLTSDGSTWSGTGVGTVQRIDIPIDPTVAGYAQIWLHLATGSASDVTIHFDPKIEVT